MKGESESEVRGASGKVPRTDGTVQRPTRKLIPIECIELQLQNNDLGKLRSVSALLQHSRGNAAIVGELGRRFERK